jgi:carbonic anhydrase/acetyltransferase-like protein (isoleucine patch superfamily)
MAAPVIQFKRGNYSGLPALKSGEPGFTTDKYDLYVGSNNTLGGNKFFGSNRYWTREDGIESAYLNLVDRDGSNKISLKSPDILAGVTTYTFPQTPLNGGILQTDADGNLSWSAALSEANLTSLFVTGIATFQNVVRMTSSLDSSDKDTGALVLEGGVGIEKSLNVGSNFGVLGLSTFSSNVLISALQDSTTTSTGALVVSGGVGIDKSLMVGAGASISGITTIASTVDTNSIGSGALIIDGGASVEKNLYVGAGLSISGNTTLNGNLVVNGDNIILGDAETDTLVLNADIDSNLLPNQDNTFNIGDQTVGKTWRDASFSGIGTFSSGVSASNVRIGVSSATTISTLLGDLVLTSSNSNTIVDGNLKVSGNEDIDGTLNVSSSATIKNVRIGASGDSEIDTTSGNLVLDSATGTTIIDDQLSVSGVSTFSSQVNATSGAQVSSVTIGLSSPNEIDTTSGNLILDSAGGTVYVDDDLFVVGSINVGNITGTASTAANALAINVSNTNEDDTFYPVLSPTASTSTGQIMSVDAGISYNPATNTLLVPNIKTSDINASDGAQAIQISDSTGNVSFASSVTIQGDITVLGTQTIVNTEQLRIEDSLIELGLVNSGGTLVPPSSDSDIDVGVVFHYYTTEAKQGAFYWDDSAQRVAIASSVTELASVLSDVIYADVEIGSLWINDCAGSSQVISCIDGIRTLENVTIDGGSF